MNKIMMINLFKKNMKQQFKIIYLNININKKNNLKKDF